MKNAGGNKYVLYDYLQVAGGAERVSLFMAEQLDMPLLVSRVYGPAKILLNEHTVKFISIGNIFTQILGRVFEAIYCHHQMTNCLKNASHVIYSGLYAPFAVRHQKQGRKIYYCHTIPRFIYDRKEIYQERIPFFLRPLFNKVIGLMRKEYEHSLKQMDIIIANSITVQARITKYLGLKSQVLYPPVDTHKFSWLSDDGYFLSLARLEKNKQVDVIVKAFVEMPEQRLIVVSGGTELKTLKKIARNSPNIHFTGWQSEGQLKDWIGRARAAIYIAKDEDFGMSPVEAMAAGKPVIVINEGGLRETITEETGILLASPPVPETVIEAVRYLDAGRTASMREACIVRAGLFDRQVFLSVMKHQLAL
jgi:glycosyltransferase involved in cell wall biosynthesis